MKLRNISLLIFTLLLAVTNLSYSMWTEEGYEKYVKKMSRNFKDGIKPDRQSVFIGKWTMIKGRDILTFKSNGVMSIIRGDETIQGSWVLSKEATPDEPLAIYKTQDSRFATVSLNKDKKFIAADIVVSYGDLFLHFNKIAK